MAYKDIEEKRNYQREWTANKRRYLGIPERQPADPLTRPRLQKKYKNDRKELSESLMTPCVVCGEDDKDVLDWHHLDPSTKRANISWLVNQRKPEEFIREEIAKCVCVCRNDHIRIHKGKITLPVSAG